MIDRTRAGLLIVALVLALAACGDDGGDDLSATDTSTTDTSTTDTSTTDTSASGAGTACEGDGATPPGAIAGPVIDVDGDGRADEAWILEADDATVTVGITTAAGGVTSIPFESGSPVTRAVFVADADEQPPTELFLYDGRTAQLHAVVDCEIVPITNPEGETYTFSLGFGEVGTGVGCVDTDEGRRLVGLDVTGRDDEASTVDWSRTIVELDGTTAANGATETGTFTFPDDDAAIELLHRVTCGDLTLDQDGVALPR